MRRFDEDSNSAPALSRDARPDLTRKPYFSRLKVALRKSGLRPTRQRLVLASLIFDGGDRHITAEMLHEQARRAETKLSLATIYNTLNVFSRAGLLREVANYGSRTWYDTNTGPHFHFYVEQTGELFDIPQNFLSIQAAKLALDGFEMVGMDLLVRIRATSGPARAAAHDLGSRKLPAAAAGRRARQAEGSN